MSYSEALEQQIALERWLSQSNPVRRDGKGVQLSDEKFRHRLSNHTETLNALAVAECFYWSPQICDVIESAARTIPPWSAREEGIITSSGFCWFGRPIAMPQAEYLGSMRGFAWNTASDGLFVTALAESPQRTNGVPDLAGWVRWGALPSMIDETNGLEHRTRAQWNIIASAFVFLEQRILVANKQQANRDTRKRLAPLALEHEPVIRVVQLRRKHQSQHEPTDEHDAVDWACQWVVSGHWRQQWYPSLNAYQPKWIMPYVKGPEDKPLKPPRAKVFAVVR